MGDKLTPAQVLYSSNEKLEEMLNKIKGNLTSKEVPISQKEADEILDFEKPKTNNAVNKQPISNNKFIRPVNGKITSNFGPRKVPAKGGSKNHQGIDIAVPVGTPVKSIADGTVIKAGAAHGYGIAVYIDHGIINGKRVVSEYGHLSKCTVKAGDKIRQGQVVAKSGNSGYSSGAHLHLTVKENNKPVNPIIYVNY